MSRFPKHPLHPVLEPTNVSVHLTTSPLTGNRYIVYLPFRLSRLRSREIDPLHLRHPREHVRRHCYNIHLTTGDPRTSQAPPNRWPPFHSFNLSPNHCHCPSAQQAEQTGLFSSTTTGDRYITSMRGDATIAFVAMHADVQQGASPTSARADIPSSVPLLGIDAGNTNLSFGLASRLTARHRQSVSQTLQNPALVYTILTLAAQDLTPAYPTRDGLDARRWDGGQAGYVKRTDTETIALRSPEPASILPFAVAVTPSAPLPVGLDRPGRAPKGWVNEVKLGHTTTLPPSCSTNPGPDTARPSDDPRMALFLSLNASGDTNTLHHPPLRLPFVARPVHRRSHDGGKHAGVLSLVNVVGLVGVRSSAPPSSEWQLSHVEHGLLKLLAPPLLRFLWRRLPRITNACLCRIIYLPSRALARYRPTSLLSIARQG
ncbi:hypothetical protein DFP72DRAFT_1072408 [Ephemerocybe angulata]|uniref:Uncharacterized protein n=1 Tax=Ephemerocybe angulata TaxID=980116 RepID=A0A8H6HPN4_9AGAR|nr:hypothetical protein DFP72DRAFT_1072408 [Tulosesus angulatus]